MKERTKKHMIFSGKCVVFAVATFAIFPFIIFFVVAME